MALTERLQLLIESVGGSAVVSEFQKIGSTGKAEFDKVAQSGTRAAAEVEVTEKRLAAATVEGQSAVAAANAKLEAAQLKAAQSAAAVERAQIKVGESAAGTTAAARAAEKLEAAELKAAHAAQQVELAQAKVAVASEAAAKAQASASRGLLEAEAAAGKLGTSGGVAATAMSKLGLSGASAGQAIGVGMAAGAAAAGLAIAGLVSKGVGQFVTLTGEVRKLKAVTGETAEEASKLRNVGAALGVDTDTLSNAFFKLSRISNASVTDLHNLGVEVVRTKSGSVDLTATLHSLAEGYQHSSDAVERNRILFDAFGKSGVALRPILAAAREEIERMGKSGPIFHDEDLATGRALTIAQRELGIAFQKLEVDLARGVIPALTTVEHAFAAVVRAADALHISIPVLIELGIAGLAATKGIALLGAAYTAAAGGVRTLTAAVTGEAAAAAAATAINEGAAVAATEFGAASGAAGVAAGGAAAKTGLFASAAAGFAALPLAGQVAVLAGGLLLVGRAADQHVGALRRIDETVISWERHIPLVGNALANLDAKVIGSGKSTHLHAVEIEAQNLALKDLGVVLSDDEERTGDLSDRTVEAAKAAAKHRQEMEKLAASVGISRDAFVHAFGDDEEAAKTAASNITSAISGIASTLGKEFDAVAAFSATNWDKMRKDAEAGVEGIKAAEEKLADARQRLVETQDKLRESNSVSVGDTQALERAQDNLTKTLNNSKSSTEQIAAARKNLADVEERVSAKTNVSVSDLIALRKAQEGVAEAESNLAGAREKAAAGLGTITDELRKFYGNAITEATNFSTGISTAIAKGYDPAFVSRLLQEGPKEAAPILAAIAADHDGTLMSLVNRSEEAIKGISDQIVEQARLTNLAVNAKTDDLRRDLPIAMKLVQEQFRLGGEASVEALARALGKSVPEARRIAEEFGITFRDTATPAVSGTSEAVDGLAQRLGNLPANTNTKVNVDTYEANRNLDQLEARLHELDASIATSGPGGGRGAEQQETQRQIDAQQAPAPAPAPAPASAPAPAYEESTVNNTYVALEREGGILRFYSDGGVGVPGATTHFFAGGGREDHVAQILPGGTNRMWAEPETGGEAYIPLAPSKRDRSTHILATVAEEFDLKLIRKLAEGGTVRFADGGRIEDDPAYPTGLSGDALNDEVARISESQPFGEQNISASNGFHAYTSPMGEQYYSPSEGFYDAGRAQPVPGYASQTGQAEPSPAQAGVQTSYSLSPDRGWSTGLVAQPNTGVRGTNGYGDRTLSARPSLSSGSNASIGGMSDEFINRLAAAIVKALGDRTIGPFIFHGVSTADLPAVLPRELRKELYLAGH